jgi:flagellar hook protein FlgE
MSFPTALSGLNAAATDLQVIGNNIANANTYGSKVARAEFSDVYANAMNGAGSNTIGIGVNLAAVAQQFTQGNITTTDNPLDLAINGTGFFEVSNGSQTLYTRNGQFQADKDGFLTTNAGLKLVGYPAAKDGTIQPGAAVPLQLPTGGIDPAPTSLVDLEFNLDSRQAATLPAAAPQISFTDSATYNNATSMTLYDAKGQEVAVSFYFQKASTDTWNVYATANGRTIAGTDAAPLPLTQIQFAPDGSAPLAPAGPIAVTIPASTNAAGAETMEIAGIQLDLSSGTQYGSSFGVTDMRQDGFTAGQLNAIAIEPNGIVSARYSNGQSKPAGQIEIATFRNPQGLQPMGDNNWAASYSSGEPVVGVPGDGSLGVLQAGALEESNIDLTGELVSMITAQRIYQANAQTIKTQDQVMSTLVNLR